MRAQGGGGGGGSAPVQVYHRFADTGYWSANVVTDNTGQAKIHLRLPDNFTTWRLDARAVTRNEQVGQAHLFTLSTRDIVLRPVTPRFFLQGDSLKVGVIVNNDLAQEVSANVSLSASGLDVQSAAGQDVPVPPHGERLLLWDASVPASASASLTFHASPSDSSVQPYAVRVRIPVHPPLTDETVATSGQVYGSIHQYVLLPNRAMSRPGALTVQISSALTAGMGGALSSLRRQPFESNDDIAARILGATALRSLPVSLTGLSKAAFDALPAIISSAARKLAADQAPDGGWPWFNGGSSNILITADVVQALQATGRDKAALARGLTFLASNHFVAPPNERAHILLVLAQSGAREQLGAETLFGNSVSRSQLDPAGIADLALALNIVGDRSAAVRLASELDARAMVSATGAHWEGPSGAQTPPTADTASALRALLRIQPSDPFVAASARWLMLARQGAAWDNPRDSAQALESLSRYARAAHEGKAAYSYAVALDGAMQLQSHSSTATLGRIGRVAIPLSSLKRGARSDLLVSRQPDNGSLGPGPLYWVASLRYYLRASTISARDQGISIARRFHDRAGRTLSSVAAGSIVQVELTISSSQTLTYLKVDDPIPAGLEAIDLSIKTSRQGLFGAWRPPHWGAGYESVSGSHRRARRPCLPVRRLPAAGHLRLLLSRSGHHRR
jgi:uncharacterized protein YfaS (alpha-2-macroglobulin family)